MKNKEYYHRLRNKYLPDKLKNIFVLESPPASGKYFYDESGKINEPLFKAMMKLIGFNPKDKRKGLQLFQKIGYFLVDATYQPINNLKGKKRNDVILRDFTELVKELKKFCHCNQIPIILIKANICRILEPRLRQEGFVVQNNGLVVPFPSNGWQKSFFEKINKFHKVAKISA
jgi:hypothetical protein